MPKATVRLQDVATAAGVSLMTASRAVNGRPWVNNATRDLVLAAAQELGYRPSRGARALASGEVKSVTVVTSNTTLYGQAMTLQGIEEAARASGFAVGIAVLESAEPQDVRNAVERIDVMTGVIVLAYDLPGTRALAAMPEGLTVVAVIEATTTRKFDGARAWLDDRHGAKLATDYLLDLGHPTVHYVPLPSSRRVSPRQAGWAQALRDRGVVAPPPEAPGWEAQSGYEAGVKLAADPSVSAILCGNDDLALGVVRAMVEAGRSVPGNVSVVGFDDVPHSAFLTPALTTVRLDFGSLGRECFRLLETVLETQDVHQSVTLAKPELIIRESAAPYDPQGR